LLLEYDFQDILHVISNLQSFVLLVIDLNHMRYYLVFTILNQHKYSSSSIFQIYSNSWFASW